MCLPVRDELPYEHLHGIPVTRPHEDPATVDVWMYAGPGPDYLTPMSTQKDVCFLNKIDPS